MKINLALPDQLCRDLRRLAPAKSAADAVLFAVNDWVSWKKSQSRRKPRTAKAKVWSLDKKMLSLLDNKEIHVG